MSEGRIKKSVNGGAPAQTNPDDRRSSVEPSQAAAAGKRAVVKSADMKEDMQKEAIDIAIAVKTPLLSLSLSLNKCVIFFDFRDFLIFDPLSCRFHLLSSI